MKMLMLLMMMAVFVQMTAVVRVSRGIAIDDMGQDSESQHQSWYMHLRIPKLVGESFLASWGLLETTTPALYWFVEILLR